MTTRGFHPRLDILPPAPRALWPELGGVPAWFTLYGGTALALHLGHRTSVDFDFFNTLPEASRARLVAAAAAVDLLRLPRLEAPP